jgi:acyl carrier protein
MVSDRLKRVILKELGLDEFAIQDDTVATHVPGWDSLSHIRVLVAVEKEYGIRLKSLEVLRMKNVGDLQRLVDAKTAP